MSNCVRKRESSVRPVICRTPQPLQTGFSAALGARGASGAGGKGSVTCRSGVCASPLSGCGSNCGFSCDDKKILSPTETKIERGSAAADGRPAIVKLTSPVAVRLTPLEGFMDRRFLLLL